MVASAPCATLGVVTDNGDHTLYRVPGGGMLHTRECPHLTVTSLAALVPATDDEVEQVPVCSACSAALDGGRRRTFTTLDQALEAFQAPVANRARVREVIAGLPHAYVWIPASGSYIGVSAQPGAEVAAYISKGHIDVRAGGGQYDREWLPEARDAVGRSGGVSAARPELVCPSCFTVLPATGRCDTCA